MQSDYSLLEQTGTLLIALPIACVAWTITHEELFKEFRDYFLSNLKWSMKYKFNRAYIDYKECGMIAPWNQILFH